jgi:hypothetical protein
MRTAGVAAISLAIAMIVATPHQARADELKAGAILGPSNWQQAENLLPPEMLDHYKKGEYENPIGDWPVSKYNWPRDFKAATETNEGKYRLGPNGEILDTTTGKQPDYILGYPFPRIDPKDPQAGTKIIWNQFYRFYYFGSSINESQVNLIAPKGLERRIDVETSYQYFDGVPVDERVPNPENFLSKARTIVQAPNDLNGTVSLGWRYRDATRRDSSWAYVPALRRVRAVSPSNRSDGFLGSDFSDDDGPFFDGKPEDFVWTFKGEADQYRLAESINLKDEAHARWVEGKGWDVDWPDLPFIGYMDAGWKGVGWAPHGAAVLAKRPFWIIEGVPKDKYYLFGKLEMYIDKITFQGAWNRKYDWKGQLLNIGQVMAWSPIEFKRPNGKVDYLQGSNSAYQCVESLKLDRATVAGIKSSPHAGFYSRVTFAPDYFDTTSMMKSGK